MRFIVSPDKMLEQGDPIAKTLFATYKNVRMPNLALSGEDAAVLVDYLERQTAAAPPPAAGTATATPIVGPYLRIQEALSADRVEGIKDAARRIAAEATKLGSSGEPIRSAAGEVQQAGDLKAARAAFGKLGDAIMIYANAAKASLGDGVHVAYCPMRRQYWLQKGTRIQNPFYGKDMLECGRLSASLPALTK
jgi:hypothetical protein